MKKLFIISAILLIVILVVVGLYFSEGNINREINKANYCEQNEDCVIVDFTCPFGCGSYINRSEKNRLDRIVSIFDILYPFYSLCEYTCIRSSLPKCENNKCVSKICDLGKYYKASIYLDDYNAMECQCPEDTKWEINENGLICFKR